MSAMVNGRLPLVVRKSRYGHQVTGTAAVLEVGATALEDTTSGPTWTTPSRLLSGPRVQNDTARADSQGKVSTLTLGSVTYGAGVAGLRVKDWGIQTRDIMRFDETIAGGPGEASIRYVVEYLGKRIAVIDSIHPAPWVGGAAPVPDVVYRSLFDWAAGEIGSPFFTVAELEALIVNVRVLVQAWQRTGYVLTWYAADPGLRLTYYVAAPPAQHSVQWQFATDAGFTSIVFDSGWHPTTGDTYTVPLDKLTGGGTRYVRVRIKDELSLLSFWSDTLEVTQFELATDLACELAADEDSDAPTWLVEIDTARWIDGSQFVRELVSASVTYKVTLDRADLHLPGVIAADIAVDGAHQGYVEVDTLAEVESTAGSFLWDEDGREGDPNVFYLHMSDDAHPIASGTGTAGGIGIVFTLPTADGPIVSGPGNSLPYLDIVETLPSFVDSIDDFHAGRRRTPTGTLTLANRIEDEPIDGSDPGPLFYRLLQTEEPNPATGMQTHRRPLRVKATLPGTLYGDALDVFRGSVRWGSSLLSGDRVSLDVVGWEGEASTARIAAEKITVERYVNAPSKSLGQTIQVAFGAGHKRARAWPVFPTASILLAGENWSAVSELYMDGAPYPGGFTFVQSTQHIRALNTVGLGILVADHDWTFDGDGELVTQWDASVTANTMAGAMLKAILIRAGIPAGDLVVEAFDRLDNPARDGESHTMRVLFDRETQALEAIRVLETSRRVHVRRRPDGRVDAVLMFPRHADANTVYLDDYDLLGEPDYRPYLESLAHRPAVEYWGYPSVDQPLAQAVALDDSAYAQWGAKASILIPTYHGKENGARAVLADLAPRAPVFDVPVRVRRRGLLTPAGSTLALRKKGALDPTGDFEWMLFQARSRQLDPGDGSTLFNLRRIGQIPRAERPH